MADLLPTDNFLVNRGDTTSTLPQSELMAELLDDDLMLVNRDDVTYKVTGQELKDSLGPSGAVAKPKIISPANGAGEIVTAESDEIIGYKTFTYSNTVDKSNATVNFTDDPSQAFDGVVATTDYTNHAFVISDGYWTVDLNVACKNFWYYGGAAANGTVELSLSDGSTLEDSDCTEIDVDYDGGYANNKIRKWEIPDGKTIVQAKMTKAASTFYCFGMEADGGLLVDDSVGLTLASDKDLHQFQPLDDVQQDSGHTPTTSKIVGVGVEVVDSELNNRFEDPVVEYIGKLGFKAGPKRFSASDKNFPAKTTGKWYYESELIDNKNDFLLSFLGFGARDGRVDVGCGISSTFGDGLCMRFKAAGSTKGGIWVDGTLKAEQPDFTQEYAGIAIDFDAKTIRVFDGPTEKFTYDFSGDSVANIPCYPWVGSTSKTYNTQARVNFGSSTF